MNLDAITFHQLKLVSDEASAEADEGRG